MPSIDISMVITTYNRGHLLKHSLDRLHQGLALPAEVIVVDDGGDDDTQAVCEALESPVPIRYVYNHNPGPSICSMARNIGLKLAENDWVVTSEPELLYRSDILAQFADLHEDHPNEIISAGKVFFAPAGWDGSLMEATGDYLPPSDSGQAVGWVAPYTALWYRPWLVEVGGWDESFPGCWGWDDTDLLTRLRMNGVGQHIALGCEAIHQFHGLGGDADSINERHFYAKSFTHGQEKHICTPGCPKVPDHPTDMIANKGRAWGQITPRS